MKVGKHSIFKQPDQAPIFPQAFGMDKLGIDNGSRELRMGTAGIENTGLTVCRQRRPLWRMK